jgi:hypothetical protein
LLKKLENCKQVKKSPEEFAIEITTLTDKLANIEIAKTANATNTVKLAVKGIYRNMGLSAFNRGIESSVRQSVIASRAHHVGFHQSAKQI